MKATKVITLQLDLNEKDVRQIINAIEVINSEVTLLLGKAPADPVASALIMSDMLGELRPLFITLGGRIK